MDVMREEEERGEKRQIQKENFPIPYFILVLFCVIVFPSLVIILL